MDTQPDFGYQGDNFVIHDQTRRNNWQVLTELVKSKNKHEWLKNHIQLDLIRRQQEEEERKRKEKLYGKQVEV